jgi:MFS family permease
LILCPPKLGAQASVSDLVITSLALLPAPLIAAYLVNSFGFGFGMRIAYTIVSVAYFSIALMRLRLTETLPPNGEKSRFSLIDALRSYPKSVTESIRVWSKVPKSAFNLFLAIIVANGLIVSCQTYFVVYATKVLGMTLDQWALITAFKFLAIAVPGIIAGFSMDAIGRNAS